MSLLVILCSADDTDVRTSGILGYVYANEMQPPSAHITTNPILPPWRLSAVDCVTADAFACWRLADTQ